MTHEMKWQPIETAPRDGTWFFALRLVYILRVNSFPSLALDTDIVRRHRTSPTSDGYWQNTRLHSIADFRMERALWAPIEMLPLVEMWDAATFDKRKIPIPICDDTSSN